MARFCTACGSELPEGARFCPECGEAVPGSGGTGPRKPKGKGAGGGKGRGTKQGGRRAPEVGTDPWLGPYQTPILISVVVVVLILLFIGTQGGTGGGPTGSLPGQQGMDPQLAQQLQQQIQTTQGQLLQNPNDQQLIEHMAHLYYDSGNFESAVEYYRRALVAKPENPELRTDMGAALDAIGRYDEARTAFLKVLEYTPDFDKALFNLGVVSEHLGDTAQAIEWYGRVVARYPNSPLAQQARTRIAELGAGG